MVLVTKKMVKEAKTIFLRAETMVGVASTMVRKP